MISLCMSHLLAALINQFIHNSLLPCLLIVLICFLRQCGTRGQEVRQNFFSVCKNLSTATFPLCLSEEINLPYFLNQITI